MIVGGILKSGEIIPFLYFLTHLCIRRANMAYVVMETSADMTAFIFHDSIDHYSIACLLPGEAVSAGFVKILEKYIVTINPIHLS
jgi:hypothetical protein